MKTKEAASPISTMFLKNGYNTDKYSLGYLDHFYDKILPPLKDDCENMLEIGCDHGGSIRLWRDFFHESTNIYGADIRDYDEPKGSTKILGDAYSEPVINKFKDNYFDIIVDDGPHTHESHKTLITKYHSKLKDGGVLIIEDIIRPNEREPLTALAIETGYESIEDYDMTGLQKTSELYNAWAGGLFVLVLTK